MRSIKVLLLLPVAVALGGCLSYGDPVYTHQPTYRYSQPAYTYSQPAYTYSQPAYTYSQPSYGYQAAPAIVAPSGSYYQYPNYSTSRYDRDGDGVADNMDRYPYDARRW